MQSMQNFALDTMGHNLASEAQAWDGGVASSRFRRRWELNMLLSHVDALSSAVPH